MRRIRVLRALRRRGARGELLVDARVHVWVGVGQPPRTLGRSARAGCRPPARQVRLAGPPLECVDRHRVRRELRAEGGAVVRSERFVEPRDREGIQPVVIGRR